MTPEKQIDLSISIVNTNNREIVRDCLRSIQQNTHQISYEILVVDNASTDGSAEMIRAEFPEVALIVNEKKQGFSTNHNKALARARGRHLMILNDDVIVLDGAFDVLVAFMDKHPSVGVTGPKFLNPNGTNQAAFGSFGTPFHDLVVRPWRLRFKPERWSLNQPTAVDWIVGACMLARRDAVEEAGYLDTQFDPLYVEEREWCYRIKACGWQAYHVPDAQIIHLGGQTRKRTPDFWTRTIYGHRLLFYRKHYSSWQVISYRTLLGAMSLIKVAYWGGHWMLNPRSRQLSRGRLVCHWQVGTQTALKGSQQV